ncbi:hypothetical protein ScPMuIL_018683 [Solemya velum]
MKFPQIVPTKLRPDMVLWSTGIEKIIIIELTVPWEDRCDEANEQKKAKYDELMAECRNKASMILNLSKTIATGIAARFAGLADEGDSEIHVAAYNGNTSELIKLLEDEDLARQKDRRNRLGCTPLRLAATAGNLKCLRALLLVGVDIEICDVKAQTPLFAAVKNSHFDCVKELLEHGASTEGSDDHATSPLYVATMQGWYDGVKILLRYGADIQAKRRSSSMVNTPTPVHLAFAHKKFEITKLFLQMNPIRIPYSFQYEIQNFVEIILHHHSGLKFLHLLYHFFGCVEFPRSCNECLHAVKADFDIEEFFKKCQSIPQSLKCCCRLAIIHQIPVTEFQSQHMNTLEIPKSLIDFLMFEDCDYENR